jgi:hypothetical protein
MKVVSILNFLMKYENIMSSGLDPSTRRGFMFGSVDAGEGVDGGVGWVGSTVHYDITPGLGLPMP